MVNYGSCMKSKHTACNMEKHFIEELSHSEEDFDVQIIINLKAFRVRNIKLGNPKKSFKAIGKLLCVP